MSHSGREEERRGRKGYAEVQRRGGWGKRKKDPLRPRRLGHIPRQDGGGAREVVGIDWETGGLSME